MLNCVVKNEKSIVFEENKSKMFNFLENYFLEHDELNLTITFLCDSLNIQRHTFYNHYKNLSDLYDEYLEYNKNKFNNLIKYKEDYPNLSMFEIIKENLGLLYNFRHTMNVIFKLSKGYLNVDRDQLAEKLFLKFPDIEKKDHLTKQLALKGIEETIKLWSLEYDFEDFPRIVHIVYSIVNLANEEYNAD